MSRSINGLLGDNRSLNGISSDTSTLSKLKADLPLEYDEETFTYNIKGLNGFTANKIVRCNSAGNALEYADDNNTEYTATLPISISPSNVISTAFTADSTTTMSNKTISDELHGNNNTETYIDFNSQYGFPIYGKYITASLRSYNMSFKNSQTSSTYPFIGVSNGGNMILHINGVGDAMTIKADRDININVGDLSGGTKQTGQIILRSVGSSTTSGTLDFNGINDKMTLKCIDGELDLGGNGAIQMTCKTDEVNVACSFICADNRFKVEYSSSYTYISNPSGTNGASTLAGCYIRYHDNASVIHFNIPYNAAVVGNVDFYYAGTIKQRLQASGICSTTGQFLDNAVFSDDRLKENETDLSNCMSIINKLKPQIYQKYSLTGLSPEDPLKPNEYVPFTDRISNDFTIQSGFIAQEVYTIPELRHIVVLPEGSDLEKINNTEISDDPAIDPSYNGWGTKTPASVLSTQIIPYLVGALKEQQAQINQQQVIIDKLISSNSFKQFKSNLNLGNATRISR